LQAQTRQAGQQGRQAGWVNSSGVFNGKKKFSSITNIHKGGGKNHKSVYFFNVYALNKPTTRHKTNLISNGLPYCCGKIS
jgi:hypothetical protein